jgi:rod shape-determining protein MreD
MALRILPLPPGWLVLNPDWMALLILYWTLVSPERVGVLAAWFLGLSADALTGRLLGQHALAYAVQAYLNLRVREHLLVFPVPLQCLWILLILLLGQSLLLWTERVELAESMRLTYWLPALTGALAWPLVLWVMPSESEPVREP